jgi:hypothetical protein
MKKIRAKVTTNRHWLPFKSFFELYPADREYWSSCYGQRAENKRYLMYKGECFCEKQFKPARVLSDDGTSWLRMHRVSARSGIVLRISDSYMGEYYQIGRFFLSKTDKPIDVWKSNYSRKKEREANA